MGDTVLTRKTVMGLSEESTEGTYEAPIAARLFRVVEPPALSPEVEQLPRPLVKGTIGHLKSLQGMRGGSMEFQVELRGGGVTSNLSDAPVELDLLLKNALGRKTAPATNATTAAGSTTTVINVAGGEGALFQVGDGILIGGTVGQLRFITAIATDALTLNQALTGSAPGSGVAVYRAHTYKPSSNDAIRTSLSVVAYLDALSSGPILKGLGCKVRQLSLSGVEVGQIPKLSVALEALDFDWTTGSHPANPAFNTTLPPVVLNALASRADTAIAIRALEMELANGIQPEEDFNAAGGKARLFVTDREITGTINPLASQSNVDIQDAWEAGTSFEQFFVLGRKDANGRLIQGTCVGIYMPNAIFTEAKPEDADGLIRHALSYKAHEAESGAGDDELYICIV